jgi:acetoacetyl-CoA reductase
MGRLALVTGGTTGIGAATSLALQKAGYTVVANNIVLDDATQKFAAETGIRAYGWDVTDPDQCMKGVEQIAADHGGATVEILVNNVGMARDGFMHKMPVENWDRVLKTNLFSVFYMSRAVIGPMRDKGFGRIVSISSINGLSGQIGQSNYSASKAAIIGFTKSLALESAKKGITVNAVAPGYTDTAMMQAIAPDILKGIIAGIPVGRLGKPEDIARAIVFLVADEAGFITGETLSVNGGQYMQ